MSRWTYLPPRLIILGLILVALWASADSISRSVIVRSIENRTGGKVEVAQLRCSVSNQKIYLKEMVLADPSQPSSNLLQADMAYLGFDANALWRRQLVITDGQTSRLMFGTPRSNVPPKLPLSSNEELVAGSRVVSSSEELGQVWLDSLVVPNEKPSVPTELQIAHVSQQIVAYWDQELKQVAGSVVDIKKLAANLNDLAVQDRSTNNPLRRKWQDVSSNRLSEMETQNKNVATKIERLRKHLSADVAAIEQAYLTDAKSISSSTTAFELDGEQLSDLLLEDLHADFVGQAVEMFQWFRTASPEISQDFAVKSQRGVDIPIQGSHAKPSYWIKKIKINGEGRLLGQHFDFSGNAYNLSTEPELLDEPAVFEFHAQGKQHAAVVCTIDRTQAESVDAVKVSLPDLNLGERTLGHKNSMQLTLGNSNKVFAEVNLKSVGEKISGIIKLRYSDIALHVDSLNEFAGGRVAALQMNEGVTAIDNFESTIIVSGDQNKVVFDTQSDLGQRFAVAINKTLKKRAGNSIQQRTDELQALKMQTIESLRDRVESQLEQLQDAITSNQSRIANLEVLTEFKSELRGTSRFE